MKSHLTIVFSMIIILSFQSVIAQELGSYTITLHEKIEHESHSLENLEVNINESYVQKGQTIKPDAVGRYSESGDARAVEIVGNYIYLADGNQFEVYQKNNGFKKIFATTTPTTTRAVKVYNDIVIVTGDEEYVALYNISDPTKPVEITYRHRSRSSDLHYGEAGIYVFERENADYLYIISPTDGIRIFKTSKQYGFEYMTDISSPYVHFGISDTVVKGNYLFMATSDNGLQVQDISDPENPVDVYIEGYQETIPISLHMRDNTLYLGYIPYRYHSTKKPYLGVLDITDPIHPTSLGNYSEYYDYHDVRVSNIQYYDGYLYALTANHGTIILNVTDSSNITRVPTPVNTNSDLVTQLQINGTYLYAAAQTDGLKVLEFTDPENPTLVYEGLDGVSEPYQLKVIDDYAYFSDPGVGFQVLNISDVSRPKLQGYIPLKDLYGFEIKNETLFIAGGTNGIIVANLTDLANITIIEQYSPHANLMFKEIELYNNYLYVADSNGGVEIITISDPLSLSWQSTFIPVSGTVHKLHLNFPYLHIAKPNGGMEILDISTPNSPISIYENPNLDVNDIKGFGKYLYLATTTNTTYMDVSDPYHPSINSCCQITQSVLTVGLSPNSPYILTSTFGSGITPGYYGNSSLPINRGWFFDFGQYVSDIVFNDSFLYTIDKNNGLVIGTHKLVWDPGKVQNVNISDNHDRSISISWSPPIDTGNLPIERYEIVKDRPQNFVQRTSFSNGTYSYVDKDVEMGSQYTYYVVAATDYTEGPPGDLMQVIPRSYPFSPKNATVSTLKGYLELYWEKPDNDGGAPITEYKIFKGESLMTLEVIATKDASSRMFTDNTVIAGNDYVFGIAGVNELGDGDMITIEVHVGKVEKSNTPFTNMWFSMIILVELSIFSTKVKKKSDRSNSFVSFHKERRN